MLLSCSMYVVLSVGIRQMNHHQSYVVVCLAHSVYVYIPLLTW